MTHGAVLPKDFLQTSELKPVRTIVSLTLRFSVSWMDFTRRLNISSENVLNVDFSVRRSLDMNLDRVRLLDVDSWCLGSGPAHLQADLKFR